MSSGAVKAWYLVHKWTSLVCTVFLLMLCITGLPLIFHEEIDHLLEGERPLPAMEAGAPSKTLEDALDTALARFPGTIPLFMSFDEDQPVVNVTTGPRPRSTVEEMNFISIHRPTAGNPGHRSSFTTIRVLTGCIGCAVEMTSTFCM